MDETFQPLFPGGPNPASFNSLSGSNATPVRPSRPQPATEKPAAVPPAAPHSCVKAATPLVTFRREGDRVTQIQVECPCGQIVVLDCEY